MAFGWNQCYKNLYYLLKIYIKTSFLKHHLGFLKNLKWSLSWMNSPKQKPIPALILKNFIILYQTTPNTYMSSQMARRTTVLNKIIHKKALLMESSIFIAEVCAIDLALNIISSDKHNKFIIFSVLTSLKNKKLENPLIVKLLSRLDLMSSHKK